MIVKNKFRPTFAQRRSFHSKGEKRKILNNRLFCQGSLIEDVANLTENIHLFIGLLVLIEGWLSFVTHSAPFIRFA